MDHNAGEGGDLQQSRVAAAGPNAVISGFGERPAMRTGLDVH